MQTLQNQLLSTLGYNNGFQTVSMHFQNIKIQFDLSMIINETSNQCLWIFVSEIFLYHNFQVKMEMFEKCKAGLES